MQLGPLLFTGWKGSSRLSGPSKAHRSGQVFQWAWQGLPDHAWVMASDLEFPTRAPGGFLHLSPTEHTFLLGKKLLSHSQAEASPFRPHKEMQTDGEKSQCFQHLLRCSFCTVCSLICLFIHLLFLSFHPALPIPKQESEKYIFCPLNYFHLKLELMLADPAVAQPQHFLYRILPVKFIRWCSITLIKMR